MRPGDPSGRSGFIAIKGPDLIAPDGSKFFIRGINLGNCTKNEGYIRAMGMKP